MSGSFVKGCVVGLLCALVGGATVALAGSGIGGVFNLGVTNSVNAKTSLTGASTGAQLRVDNTNAVAGASGLVATSKSISATGSFTNTGGGPAGAFAVNAGVTPFTVNSQVKVTNLNADLLDGFHVNQIMSGGGRVAQASGPNLAFAPSTDMWATATLVAPQTMVLCSSRGRSFSPMTSPRDAAPATAASACMTSARMSIRQLLWRPSGMGCRASTRRSRCSGYFRSRQGPTRTR
jgi:hypothetical protein